MNSSRKLLVASFISLFALFVTVPSFAAGFTPSAAQIEQFKRMSPEQQKALASSMGINLEDYSSLIGGNSASSEQKAEAVSGVRKKAGARNGEQIIEQTALTGVDAPSLKEDESEESTWQKLELFGYDIFNYGADSFTPASDIPIPADYILGPGDNLVIQLYGKDNQTLNLALDREGRIQFPNIGPVNLAGLTFSQASTRIDTIVSEQMIGVKASTSMGSLRTIRVFVLGEANVPGSYVVGSLSTMTNAIFASGGITKIGSLRNIQLKRRGKVVTTLDLYDLLLQGDTSNDSRLLPGDVIFIPPIGKTVGVAGQVKRPAIYEITKEADVQGALDLAGGLLPTAYMPASRIERITDAGEKTLVNLDLTSRSGREFRIKDADVIQIHTTLDTMRDIVKLEGHVKRPGGFAWRKGIRFTDVVPSVDDMLANPDIDVGLILREEKSTRKISVHLFTPAKAFDNPNSKHNPELQSRDTILLFDYESDRSLLLEDVLAQLRTQSSFTEREKIVIAHGSVRFPGQYPISEGMTTTDLIMLAGGLTESALGNDGEITRYSIDENRQTLVMHINIDLDAQAYPLTPGDTLRVKQIPLWNDKESIVLLGEVLHPGTYPILPGESIVDVLSRAGGLTPHAYPEGAIFSREELRKLEEERLAALKNEIEADLAAEALNDGILNKSKVDSAQAEQIIANMDAIKPMGRMVIDLPQILANPKLYDFKLENGDVLTIPRFKPSVTVVGEVQYPTSHFFDKKLNPFDYIDRSGGTKENADKKRIYIVKANGSVYLPANSGWFKSKDHNIRPGDTIIVPLDTDRVDPLTLWSSVTTIMYQAALGITALTKL